MYTLACKTVLILFKLLVFNASKSLCILITFNPVFCYFMYADFFSLTRLLAPSVFCALRCYYTAR
jgi:hypothetical protein